MKKKHKKQEALNDIINNSYRSNLLSFNTQYCSVSPYTDTTVVRTPDMVMKGSLFSKNNRFRSEEYLLNYRTNNYYIGFKAGVGNFFQTGAALTSANKELEEELSNVVYLSNPKKVKTSLGMAITERRSIRNYSNDNISEKELSTILYYSQGVSTEAKIENIPAGKDTIKLRNAPSGGGLYPIKLYVYISNVKGLRNGIYMYYPYSHSLKPINLEFNKKDSNKLAEFAMIQSENLNLIFFYVYDVYINTRKYGDGGMAYAFIEAGEIAQNVQLLSTALGLGACDLGGYEKQFIEKTLNIDGITKHVIHVTVVGNEDD
ncbi:SagB family peptide dehydrogenase [Clostridium oceanicum]|uniref:SagB family peptide dehydrogenase n=1 Tax=Clostridium oceanicum TaxID=1543 RepID=A0ABN1J8T3_9CLOT